MWPHSPSTLNMGKRIPLKRNVFVWRLLKHCRFVTATERYVWIKRKLWRNRKQLPKSSNSVLLQSVGQWMLVDSKMILKRKAIYRFTIAPRSETIERICISSVIIFHSAHTQCQRLVYQKHISIYYCSFLGSTTVQFGLEFQTPHNGICNINDAGKQTTITLEQTTPHDNHEIIQSGSMIIYSASKLLVR